MKKISLICAVAIAGMSLAACGNSSSKKNTTSKQTSSKVAKKYYFDGKTANLKDEKITINKVSFYKGDESSNNKNLIVFDYTITNKSDKDIDAISGWQAVFKAYQDNKNTEGELEVGGLPSDTSEEVLHNQDQIIKKGGSVKCRAAYQLDSNSKPVVLKAIKGYDGDFLGKKNFKIGNFKPSTDQTNIQNQAQSNNVQIKEQNSVHQRNQTTSSQSANGQNSGNTHKDTQLWVAAQNNDNWQGTMYENVSPQERYNYISSQADHSQQSN